MTPPSLRTILLCLASLATAGPGLLAAAPPTTHNARSPDAARAAGPAGAPGHAPLPARPAPAHAAPVPTGPLAPLVQLLRGGRYAEVAAQHKRISAGLRTPAERARADALLGEALMRAGRLAEAETVLSAATTAAPTVLEARSQLALLLRKRGQHDRAKALWNRFFDDHDAGALDMQDPAVLRQLGVAARYIGSYQDANETLRDAAARARELKRPAELARADVEWAALFLEKYAAGESEQSLKEALAQDPDDPDAHALLARVKLEQGNDVAGAEAEIAAALRVHPRHAEALAARTTIQIDNEEYEAALRTTDTMLAADPTDLGARSLRAAALLLLERTADFAAEKARVLAQDARYTELHRTVAELLTTQHRYEEAVTLLEEAVTLDPRDAYALSALGSGYLRLGQDDKGLESLRRAWKGDHFNVRTFNLLELFEKIIPKSYEIVTVDIDPRAPGKGGLRLRLPSAERATLLPLLVPMIQAEWQDLCARYGFTPRLPLTLELYADPQHYAVRTVGLPGLAALGVTFGRVVTGRSPAQAAFNWGLMIWHEVSHVFAIQLSRSRVPRWFTEGLSEWETAHRRKEWTRRTSAELYAALRDDKLPSLGELNAGFTRAKDVAHIVVAYHEAAAAMDFLIRRFGFPKISAALRLFARGQRTAEVLPQVTGMSLAALDQAFRADLRARLSAYAGTFYVRPTDYSDAEGLEAELKAHPDDARLHGLHGLLLLSSGQADKAAAAADKALALSPRCREAHLLRAELRLRKKDADGAAAALAALLDSGGDGYDARYRLGLTAVLRGDIAAAERELNAAKRLDPDRPEPYAELARLYTKNKREADALRELGGATELEIMDADLARALVRRLHAAGRWDDVLRYGELARHLSPYDADLRGQIGEAFLQRGRRAEARAEIDAALACLGTPADEEEAAQQKARRDRLLALKARAGR